MNLSLSESVIASVLIYVESNLQIKSSQCV